MPIQPGGQGKSLPEDFAYKGEWVIENLMFLYEPTNQKIEPGAPRIDGTALSRDGDACIGFDVTQLAEAFKMTPDAIWAANHAETLLFISVQHGTLFNGKPGRNYIFNIEKRSASIAVEFYENTGTA